MRSIPKVITAIVAATFIMVSLTSCSSTEKFSEAAPADLPKNLAEELGEPIDGSVRLLGEDNEGVTYYAGRWDAEGTEEYCLVMVQPDDFGRFCGGELPVTGVFAGIRATLSSSAGDESEVEGAEQIGDYLVVNRP